MIVNIVYQEKVEVWKEVQTTLDIPDGTKIDKNNKEDLSRLIEENSVESMTINTFEETEEHKEYDFEQLEVLGE